MRKINKPKLRFKEFKEDWKVKKIDDIAKVYDGTHQTPKYKNNGVPFVSAENIKDLYSSGKYISVEDFKSEYKNGKAEKGDLLMTRIGKIGIVNIVTENTPVAYYVTLALLKLNNKNDSRFNMYLIQADKVQRELWAKTLHIAFPPKINKNEIPKVNITTTNLEEQRQIGLFFDKIDNLIELKNDKIASLERLKRGYLQKLFTDLTKNKPKLRFKEFNDSWKVKGLGDISQITQGIAGDLSLNNGKFKLTRIETISNGKINFNKLGFINEKPNDKYLLKNGDILFSNINSLKYIGNNAMFNSDHVLYHGMNLLRIRTNINYNFLHFELNTFNNKKWAIQHSNPAVSQASINKSTLSEEPIAFPSDKEQSKIANLMTLIDKQINLQQKELDRLKSLKKGYLQKMFV